MLDELVMSWNARLAKLLEITQSKSHDVRRSRSFKVTDFSTNRKLIYDFLLVINNNLPPILHRFQVIRSNCR